MREIKAIIQPFMLAQVVDALRDMEGLPGLTVSEVRGFGKQEPGASSGEVIESYVEFMPKAKLEIVLPDNLVESVVQVILEKAHTGNPGDGKLFIHEVNDAILVRTGERGESAI